LKKEKQWRRDLSREAIHGMKRILLTFRTRVDEEFRPKGVTLAQVQMLFAVLERAGSSGAELARRCHVTPQTAQALLSHLEKHELIVRGKDRRNQRIVTATVTEKGRELAEEIRESSNPLQQVLWKGIGDDELVQFNEILGRCIANLEQTGD
jgi:MarR family transcriptional regulator, organic hydroperoxide resistance regulator